MTTTELMVTQNRRRRRVGGVGQSKRLLFFAVPALIFYGFAVVWPSIRGAGLAFTNWDGLSQDYDVVWFDNFIRIFTTESSLRALLMTLVFALAITILQNGIGLVLASAFEPVMGWMRARMPNVLATIILLLAILGVIGGVIWAMVRAVLSQWDDLYASAEEGVRQVIEWVNTLPYAPSQQQLDEWWVTLQEFATSAQFGSSVGSGAVAGVGAVANFVTGLVLMAVVLFFFLKDGPQIWRFLLRPFQGEWHERMERVGHKSVDTLGAYVRGTAAVAAVDAIGIGIGIGLMILQIPLALPLTLLVFLLAFIPIVGATLAGILAALVGLVDGGFMDNGLIAAIIIVAIVVGVNQIEGNLLQPLLMGRALKLHSLVILIALTVGTLLTGILGAVLAVPLAAVAWGIVQVWDGPSTPARWARKKPGE